MLKPYRCPACGARLKAWLPGPGGRPDAACPRCGSLERHRFLALLLDRLAPVMATASHVVEVAPTPVVRKLLRQRVGRRYLALDLGLDRRRVDLFADLTKLPLSSGSIDFLVALHVLEHVPDDACAMREIARVLGPAGLALVQVPWRRTMPATIEDPDAPPEVRAARFGQADHVRYYGADFEDRIEAAGLTPLRIEPPEELTPSEMARYNVKPHEPIWLCVPQACTASTLNDVVDRARRGRPRSSAYGSVLRNRL